MPKPVPEGPKLEPNPPPTTPPVVVDGVVGVKIEGVVVEGVVVAFEVVLVPAELIKEKKDGQISIKLSKLVKDKPTYSQC